jgi:hypothetical protein
MRRALILSLVLLAAASSFGEEPKTKRALIDELLQILPWKRSMDRSVHDLFARRMWSCSDCGDDQDEVRARVQERLSDPRIYDAYLQEVYVPLLEASFTADQLRETLAFLRTKSGQRLGALLSELTAGNESEGRWIEAAVEAAEAEVKRDHLARHPWKKTMADMRWLATALEARATDTNEYPIALLDDLEPMLSPTYIKTMPKVDGWGTPYRYLGDGDHYRIISAGADHRFEPKLQSIGSVVASLYTDDPDADIVYEDGSFIQAPREARPPQQQ